MKKNIKKSSKKVSKKPAKKIAVKKVNKKQPKKVVKKPAPKKVKKQVKKPVKKVSPKKVSKKQPKKVVKKNAPKKNKKPVKKIVKKAPAKKAAPKKTTKKTPAKKAKKPVKKTNKKQATPKTKKSKFVVPAILEADSKVRTISDFEFREILTKLIYKARTKKRNKNTIDRKRIYKAFENYNFSDELSNKVNEELAKANITIVGSIIDQKISEEDDYLPKNKDYQINNLQGIKISTKDRVADGVKTFLGTLGSSKMLKAEDEVRIAKQLGSKDPVEHDYAVNQLVTSNLRLVTSIARRFLNRGLDLEDLIQEGTMGLMKAISKFDYKLGNKFSTYAT